MPSTRKRKSVAQRKLNDRLDLFLRLREVQAGGIPDRALASTQPLTTTNTAPGNRPHTAATSKPSNVATSTNGRTCPVRIQARIITGSGARPATTPSDQDDNTPTSSRTPDSMPATQAAPSNADWPIGHQLLAGSNADYSNLHLDLAKANAEKKRKPEGN